MGEKTKFNNDQEDELNQSRFLAERGSEVIGTQAPAPDGVELDEEDILDTKSRFREQPSSVDEESDIALNSPYYGQGFEKGDDKGIRREPESPAEDEIESLGA